MTPDPPAPLDRLSPAARRLLAVALLLPAPLLAWALLAAPLLAEREEAQARVAAALALEARALAIAARAPALEAERAALAAALARAEGPPLGGSHALAGAGLQRRLREAAARGGAALRSLETLPETEPGLVALRGQMRATGPALAALLGEIEGGAWGFAQVTALTVAVAPGPVLPGEPRALEVQFALRVLRGGAPP